jgi:hypothetical protein
LKAPARDTVESPSDSKYKYNEFSWVTLCRKLRDSVGPRSNAIQRRLAERPSKHGPTNPGNHQTVVSSVGERTSNGCQRRFDGDVGFGCSRNTLPTALERRSRWNAGIKVCDIVYGTLLLARELSWLGVVWNIMRDCWQLHILSLVPWWAEMKSMMAQDESEAVEGLKKWPHLCPSPTSAALRT